MQVDKLGDRQITPAEEWRIMDDATRGLNVSCKTNTNSKQAICLKPRFFECRLDVAG
jgi:hypothetical protein